MLLSLFKSFCLALEWCQWISSGFLASFSACWDLSSSLSLDWRFPDGSASKASAFNAGEPGSIPGSGRSPGDGKGQPAPVLLPGKSHGQRNLVGYSPCGHTSLFVTGLIFLNRFPDSTPFSAHRFTAQNIKSEARYSQCHAQRSLNPS